MLGLRALLRLMGARVRPRALADIGGEEEEQVCEQDYKRAVAVREATDDSEIEPGSRVRLQLSKTKAFAKSKFSKAHEHTWTTAVYIVIAHAGPNSFLIDVPPGEIKVWPLHSLQIVKKSLDNGVSGPKINKAVVSAQRIEARNISPEEVAAAQAAPARPRSERAPKVDYKPKPQLYRRRIL